MKWRYLVLLAFAVIGLAFGRQPEAALAQTDNQTIKFKNSVVWIRPEYDDPRLLVMFGGRLDGVEAPVRVSFLVPAAAEVIVAGSIDAQDRYSPSSPDRQASSVPGWEEVSFELTTDTFRVEYYDSIIQGYPNKTIAYDFRTISPISDLRVIVQQPRQSFDFTVAPRGTIGSDSEEFTTFTSAFSNVIAEAPLHFDIAYTREVTEPSIQPQDSESQSPTLIIGLVLGVLVIGGGVVWFLKSRQPQRVPVSGTRKERRQAARQRRSSGNSFCTNCGQPLDASDKFCPSCGDKVRD